MATAFFLLEIPIPYLNSISNLDTLPFAYMTLFSLSPHALPVCCFRSPSNACNTSRNKAMCTPLSPHVFGRTAYTNDYMIT